MVKIVFSMKAKTYILNALQKVKLVGFFNVFADKNGDDLEQLRRIKFH